ncbi:MAG: hypothetical protein VKJ46_04865, partial [Leptolyngbyaceae bacterium]|nr:hypothetical protein [Leptolyngbyaceae bacterium]
PNPTTGWYAIVAENEVMNLSMSIEDAFKVIISGGIVSPSNSPIPASPSNAVPLALSVSSDRKLEQPIGDPKWQVLSQLPLDEDG